MLQFRTKPDPTAPQPTPPGRRIRARVHLDGSPLAVDPTHYNYHYNVIHPRAPSPESPGLSSYNPSPVSSRPASPISEPDEPQLRAPSPVRAQEPAPLPAPPAPPDALAAYWARLRAQAPEREAHDRAGEAFGAWFLPEASPGRQEALGRLFVRTSLAARQMPEAILETLQALHQVHTLSSAQQKQVTHAQRSAALLVLIDICDLGILREPMDVLSEARAMPWTRLVQFSGAEGLGAVMDTMITGALASATYQAGVECGRRVAQLKTLSLTAKAIGLGAGAVASGAVTGLGAAASGLYAVNAVRVHYATIQAFRDVWDNDFSRDAFFVHRMRDHVVASRESNDPDPTCRHTNSAWTPPHAKMRAKWKNDYRGFDHVK